jgi:hypothetical protein
VVSGSRPRVANAQATLYGDRRHETKHHHGSDASQEAPGDRADGGVHFGVGGRHRGISSSRRAPVNKQPPLLQLLLCGAEENFAVTDVTRLDTIPAVFCSLRHIVTEKAEFKANPAFRCCCDFISLAV